MQTRWWQSRHTFIGTLAEKMLTQTVSTYNQTPAWPGAASFQLRLASEAVDVGGGERHLYVWKGACVSSLCIYVLYMHVIFH